MEKMHKESNNFDQCDERSIQNILKSSISKPTTEVKIAAETNIDIVSESERTLSSQESAKKIRNLKTNCGISKIEKQTVPATSCTSSIDSGVYISDNNDTPPSPAPTLQSTGKTTTVKQFNKQLHKYTDTDKNLNKKNNNNRVYSTGIDNEGCDGDENYSTNLNKELKRRMQQHSETVNDCASDEHNRYQAKQNFIDSGNGNKVNQQQNLLTTPTTNNDNLSLQHNGFINRQDKSISTPPSPSILSSSSSASSTISSKINLPSNVPNCNSSPVVSIRSICSSTIITSDSDSDSDIDGDIEGVHENYVIKKLGTQVTFPPRHPEIPNINSGHTLLNQQVQTTGGLQQPSPLAALAAIGDTFGQAQALGAVPSVSQGPKIGSIALSNSSDVTFGDKHFYEGPVTIQQFLIDTRDKWKDTNGKDNPTFVNDNSENPNNAKDINSSSVKSDKIYEYILTRKKLFIPGGLAIAALLIVGTIFGVLQNESKSKLIVGNNEESRKNIPINSTIAQDNFEEGRVLRIVARDTWLAQPPINPWIPLKHPVNRVIVIPTRTAECETQAACTYTVRITQTFNIESQQQDDIIYNFLIGGDGNVYEGRGWDNRGSVVKGFNDDSISFAYIGLFKKQPPSHRQLNVTKLLLKEGVRLKKLSSNYRIVGAHSLDPTSVLTSADALYKSFENWPHWSDK